MWNICTTTHINVNIPKHKYSYICIYHESCPKVNKKSFKTSSAFGKASNDPLP